MTRRNQQSKPFKFPHFPPHWEQFLLSLIFLMFIPLFPLGIEKYVAKSISEQSLNLTTSIYAISTGVSSRSRLQFGFGIAVSIVFSVLFGFSTAKSAGILTYPNSDLADSSIYAVISISAISFFHLCERFNRHVTDKEDYWNF